MLKQRVMFFSAAVLVIAVIYTAHGQQRESRGREPYTPTKIEWLALELQAYYGDQTYRDDPYVVYFHHHELDTIEVHLRYMGRRDQGVELELQTAKDMVRFLANKHGWQDWVKTTEDVRKSSEESLPDR